MIDPNFLRFLHEEKQRQIQFAPAKDLPLLTAQANEVLRLLSEGNCKQQDIQRNQYWLSKKHERPSAA